MDIKQKLRIHFEYDKKLLDFNTRIQEKYFDKKDILGIIKETETHDIMKSAVSSGVQTSNIPDGSNYFIIIGNLYNQLDRITESITRLYDQRQDLIDINDEMIIFLEEWTDRDIEVLKYMVFGYKTYFISKEAKISYRTAIRIRLSLNERIKKSPA